MQKISKRIAFHLNFAPNYIKIDMLKEKNFQSYQEERIFMAKKKYCYLFSEGNAQMRELLGGKGANLAEMTKIGLPVPQGFTTST